MRGPCGNGTVYLARLASALVLAAAFCAAALGQEGKSTAARQLWLYSPTNLLVDENVDKLAGGCCAGG